MKTITLFTVLALASCSDDPERRPDARPPVDAAVVTPKTYKQVEVLARPGIAEALLISNNLLAAYNATGPTFAGVDPAPVVAEAKTVLKALYLGACLLNGVIPGLTAATGVKPAAIQCHAIGGELFVGGNPLTGTMLTMASVTASQAYADKVFAQFVPDVMRIDMSIPTSTYENLCGDPTMALPLLCGGRFLDDDVIDTTYDYLLNGAALGALTGGAAVYNQFSALVSDGVNFSDVSAQNKNSRVPSVPTNRAQFHTTAATPAPVSTTFPYSANPL
ncbi:MAG: DUF4331 family protein [Deltaproteobacteria bacterium]|nr:DUF4331 family protein [Deltaproteobacteria bacterium]